MVSAEEPVSKAGAEFEQWIKTFADYLKSLNTTVQNKTETDYSSISLSDRLNNNSLWPKISNAPLDEFLERLGECFERAVPANLEEIPRSDSTPLWLCNKRLHNGCIPVPEDRRWHCNDHILGIWVWYGWYLVVSPLFPQCDPEFVPKFAVYGLSDWGHTPTLLKKFNPPMFHNDQEILESARRSFCNGYDIARTVPFSLCELGFETIFRRHSCSKWDYSDWTTVALMDAKIVPQVASLEWNIKPGGISGIFSNHLRLLHDITDYAADVIHSECANTRIQHDLSCSLTGCIWSEINRLTARIDAYFGRPLVNLYVSAAFWWQLSMGRYHIMPKLCYAVRHCKIPTPTDCPWTGFPSHPVVYDILQNPDPVSGLEVCRGPCVEIGSWPKSYDEVAKMTEAAFLCIFDPAVCYGCALKVSDHLTGSIQQLPPIEGIKFFQSGMSWMWEGPVLTLYWKAAGHMAGVIAPPGSHDEKTCMFT
ncbi:hypothetical protein AOL_s00117g29 [Orbilia oligospora ATCC 24927]|uniref:Uncharacterized protein n=1 Tax=Arthrobotrys oligospora (strain ATCC 24927 / CBS 115.81 / DSM 1491) TaxID=756982 RepID=G1XLY2_ARTOA|nr:hypothetical protein AOL_s00117g29 [Orbilia oligospora ATCC 24927]EGX45824.1 hypothetical protein AOL_s00117g29 [Orbilia oligospora ATCC 24927]